MHPGSELCKPNYSNPNNVARPRLKRVEVKEGRGERGLAFRNPNISNVKD